MKRTLLTLIVASFLYGTIAAENYTTQKQQVLQTIHQVNQYWQTTNPTHGNSFWDNAAYHTGNMEVVTLTGNSTYRKYSEAWAEHNEWKGAKSDNRSEWKYTYGEQDDYVLFGDFQICFQTYIDLYKLSPDPKKIARAKEVMEYQMSTNKNDYWWWSDGLYMVMPVMTKMYTLTGDQLYLNKLREYIDYADSIMYDAEAGLYYRDAKYVYPKHKSTNQKKDFWARGDGWVFAGIAKVLQDLPMSDPSYSYFVNRFQAMAKSLAACQQSEGYWTRSMLDPEHAPGPETSGTAFFIYGFQWGVNNNILHRETYTPVIEKGWQYLSTVALQPNGKIGYIQPIGEKAIPGQIVNSNSTSNFGVGAYLLAACERVRYLEALEQQNDERTYWSNLLYRISKPVLEPMSRGKLQEEMLVELSPTWDGRDKRVTYMEAFGRLMSGLAPWLSLPDDHTPEGVQRKELRAWALKSYAHSVDPQSKDYLLWRTEGQPLVDAAYIALSFLRAYDQLWLPLDEKTKERYIAEFQQLRRVDPPYTNWLLFSATIECFLLKANANPDKYRINSALRKIEEWYVGDGWYADGPEFAFDYYNSFVIQPMYLECLEVVVEQKQNWIARPERYHVALKRAQKYSQILERFVSPEGTFPVIGRSITYRLGIFQPLALLAWKQQLPNELPNGQVKSAITLSMKRMFASEANFNEKDYLTLGFAGHQPHISDWYTNNGSLYLTSLAFLPLGLPADHPFWTDKALPCTQQKAWNGVEFPKDHAIRE